MLFSDLHVDYEYTIGTSNNCGRVTCCRSDSGPPRKPEEAAAKWGDYQCDIPERTMESFFDFVSNKIKPDFALWGGDSVPHNVATITFDGNVRDLTRVSHAVQDGL